MSPWFVGLFACVRGLFEGLGVPVEAAPDSARRKVFAVLAFQMPDDLGQSDVHLAGNLLWLRLRFREQNGSKSNPGQNFKGQASMYCPARPQKGTICLRFMWGKATVYIVASTNISLIPKKTSWTGVTLSLPNLTTMV